VEISFISVGRAVAYNEKIAFFREKIHVISTVTIGAQLNQRLLGACNRSPGSKLLSITTQLHCGGHLGGRARLPDTILEKGPSNDYSIKVWF
jgi:hypothetical protein